MRHQYLDGNRKNLTPSSVLLAFEQPTTEQVSDILENINFIGKI
jgi:hypothetical protein